MFDREGERRPDLEDIGGLAAGSDQHVLTVQRAHQTGGPFRPGGLAVPIRYELDTEIEPAAAHLADPLVDGGELAQLGLELSADARNRFQQALVLDHREHGRTDGGGNGVAAEGVEVAALLPEGRNEI